MSFSYSRKSYGCLLLTLRVLINRNVTAAVCLSVFCFVPGVNEQPSDSVDLGGLYESVNQADHGEWGWTERWRNDTETLPRWRVEAGLDSALVKAAKGIWLWEICHNDNVGATGKILLFVPPVQILCVRERRMISWDEQRDLKNLACLKEGCTKFKTELWKHQYRISSWFNNCLYVIDYWYNGRYNAINLCHLHTRTKCIILK